MFDPITLAVGGGLVLVGWVGGRIGRRPALTNSDAPEPTCGCEHSLALHNPYTSECHGQIRRPHYEPNGAPCGKEWVDCDCRRYVGPEPVEQFYASRQLPPI